jgi:hypothetical protein
MESSKEAATRLIKALALHRDEYVQGKLDSLTWIRARRMVMREAEFLGVTDMMLRGGGNATTREDL